MMNAMLAEMSAGNESALFFTPAQREAVLKGLFANYYGLIAPARIVFDTNRGWTARIDLLATLFPQAKIICCVRHIPWIIDSVERLIRKNKFELSKIFSFEVGGTVYSRAEGLMSASGLIGYPLNAMKQAMHSAEAGRILLLPYDTLVNEPAAAMAAVYAFTGLAPFKHDFENARFDVREFDARLGTPGLHDVRPKVAAVERKTILPPDLWERYERASIWRMPEFNTLGVPVACEPAEAPG
jgi:sulfotransferase